METRSDETQDALLSAMSVTEQEVFFLREEGADLTDPSTQRILGGAIGSQIGLHRPELLQAIGQTVGYVLRCLLATEERPLVVMRSALDFITERERLHPRAESVLGQQSV